MAFEKAELRALLEKDAEEARIRAQEGEKALKDKLEREAK